MNTTHTNNPTHSDLFQHQRSITTTDASRTLRRLCKHFSHKVEASWDDHYGKVRFVMGECLLEAQPTSLLITIRAADTEGLEKTIGVIDRHLPQFLAPQQANR